MPVGQTINGHTLVDLIPPHDNLHKLSVNKAILWVRLSFNRSIGRHANRNTILNNPVTLYVVRVYKSSQINDNNDNDKYRSSNNFKNQQPLPAYPTPFFQSRKLTKDGDSGKEFPKHQTNSNKSTSTTDDDDHLLSFELLTTHRLNKPTRGWTQIDLTTAINQWFKRSANINQKLTLLIDCSGCKGILDIDLATSDQLVKRSLVREQKEETNGNSQLWSSSSAENGHTNKPESLFTTSQNGNSTAIFANTGPQHRQQVQLGRKPQRRHFQPFVVITTKTMLKRRNRRHAYNCEDGVKQCCKQSLYVDFSKLGWNDWIIFPKGYTANYCMGECVQLHRTPDVMAYFHSHVLEEYRTRNPYASITPCCAPTKLSSISLIYFDPDGHIIKSDLPKMVVDECGCT